MLTPQSVSRQTAQDCHPGPRHAGASNVTEHLLSFHECMPESGRVGTIHLPSGAYLGPGPPRQGRHCQACPAARPLPAGALSISLQPYVPAFGLPGQSPHPRITLVFLGSPPTSDHHAHSVTLIISASYTSPQQTNSSDVSSDPEHRFIRTAAARGACVRACKRATLTGATGPLGGVVYKGREGREPAGHSHPAGTPSSTARHQWCAPPPSMVRAINGSRAAVFRMPRQAPANQRSDGCLLPAAS